MNHADWSISGSFGCIGVTSARSPRHWIQMFLSHSPNAARGAQAGKPDVTAGGKHQVHESNSSARGSCQPHALSTEPFVQAPSCCSQVGWRWLFVICFLWAVSSRNPRAGFSTLLRHISRSEGTRPKSPHGEEFRRDQGRLRHGATPMEIPPHRVDATSATKQLLLRFLSHFVMLFPSL